MYGMKKKFALDLNAWILIGMTFFASFFFNLVFLLFSWNLDRIVWIKMILLCVGLVHLLVFRRRNANVIRYACLLIAITGLNLVNGWIGSTGWFLSVFPQSSFFGSVGANISLKWFNVLVLIALLLAFYRKPSAVGLVPGDLRVKAAKIPWLGIPDNWVSWGRLSWVSGILISLGTILLTFVTVIGTISTWNFALYARLLPLVIGFAVLNSFAEGMMFRNSVISPLETTAPKEFVILLAAAFFGSFHYYGAPGGILGVLMAGLLGWFMGRCYYETKGFLAPWIIHFFQDFVVFSTLVLLGGFVS